VILLDQFTRNIARSTPSAFAGDRAALEVRLAAIDRGHDRKLRLIERSFLYVPMMHAEDRDVARRSIEMFEELSGEIAALGHDYPRLSFTRRAARRDRASFRKVPAQKRGARSNAIAGRERVSGVGRSVVRSAQA
jgi:uncharacterized protein (DUF924 family)